jgi:hypothetical protein
MICQELGEFLYLNSNMGTGWVWWLILVIPAVGRPSQESYGFKAIANFLVISCLNTGSKKFIT